MWITKTLDREPDLDRPERPKRESEDGRYGQSGDAANRFFIYPAEWTNYLLN